MNAIPYADDPYEDDPLATPARPHRRFWGPATAALLALLLGAVGFFAGVRVEKGQLSSAGTGSAGRALSLAGTGSTTGSGRGSALAGGGTSSASGAGPGAASGAGPGAAGFRGLGAGGAGASFGTVSTIDGDTFYVTAAGGNTVKVSLSSATKITKSVGVSKSAVRPGDAVLIQGLKSADGTIQATSVSDSGARASATGSSRAGAATGGSGSAGSAVNQLFGGG